jgi:hypothetical protein
MNTDPLVIYTVYLNEGAHSRAPSVILEGQARGYYTGKVSLFNNPSSLYTFLIMTLI